MITEQVKAKLKEIKIVNEHEMLSKKGEVDKRVRLARLKLYLSGMQTAIKSELEFIREINLWEVVSSNSICLNEVEERITDCKNALSLIEEKK